MPALNAVKSIEVKGGLEMGRMLKPNHVSCDGMMYFCSTIPNETAALNFHSTLVNRLITFVLVFCVSVAPFFLSFASVPISFR